MDYRSCGWCGCFCCAFFLAWLLPDFSKQSGRKASAVPRSSVRPCTSPVCSCVCLTWAESLTEQQCLCIIGQLLVYERRSGKTSQMLLLRHSGQQPKRVLHQGTTFISNNVKTGLSSPNHLTMIDRQLDSKPDRLTDRHIKRETDRRTFVYSSIHTFIVYRLSC